MLPQLIASLQFTRVEVQAFLGKRIGLELKTLETQTAVGAYCFFSHLISCGVVKRSCGATALAILLLLSRCVVSSSRICCKIANNWRHSKYYGVKAFACSKSVGILCPDDSPFFWHQVVLDAE